MPDPAFTRKYYALFKNSLSSFTSIFIVFTVFFLGMRIYELFSGIYYNSFHASKSTVVLLAIVKDITFLLAVFLWFFVLYLLLYLLNKKIATAIILVMLTFFMIIYFSLIKYFLTTLIPLGADLWNYSWKDIAQTVSASGTLRISSLLPVIVFFIIVFYSFKHLPKKLYLSNISIFSVLSVAILVNIFGINRRLTVFNFSKKEFENNLSENKGFYFFAKSKEFFFQQQKGVDIYSEDYFKNNISDYAFSSFLFEDEESYPFLHQEATPDVLGGFFDTAALKPPNIVFILAEGLGRAFSNEGAYWGSFTPFLDSLSGKSLYWENCLSQGGRTFAVLPAVLGSLPFGKNGFLDIGKTLPDHFSLLNLLGNQNYNTGFYYGGNASFDGMENFLYKNGINTIIDEKTFSTGYEKMPADENGFSWGYGDKELFRKYLNTRLDNKKPYLDVILTVSTHNPFRINDQNHYLQLFEERLKTLGFTETEKQDHRNYKFQGASILFLDDAIKDFFAEFKKRDDYNNTVFVITGDHRMPEIPMSSKIDRYHVPLIIYSALLQRTSKFSSIVSHNAITPSILAWMQKQYAISLPQRTTWLSHGLDTNKNFRNIQQTAFMQTKSGISDFLSGLFFLDGSDLYTITKGMDLEKNNDENIQQKIKTDLEKFISKNNQLTATGILLPDSLYKKYIQ